jgi:hypothetical protein
MDSSQVTTMASGKRRNHHEVVEQADTVSEFSSPPQRQPSLSLYSTRQSQWVTEEAILLRAH